MQMKREGGFPRQTRNSADLVCPLHLTTRGRFMSTFKSLSLAVAVAVIGFTAAVPQARAQVGIDTGVAPECPYGYYDYAPYDCAPYGYYGPEWFVGGVFLGAGPWFHGPRGFFGHVANRYDPH